MVIDVSKSLSRKKMEKYLDDILKNDIIPTIEEKVKHL
jgi:hypothetical protein